MEAKQPSKDWSAVRRHTENVIPNKKAFLDNEFMRNMRGDTPNFEEWWAQFVREHPRVFEFSSDIFRKNAVITSRTQRYEVVDTFPLSAIGNMRNVMEVRNKKGDLKILKRLTPDDALNFYLNAAELEENSFPSCTNTKMISLDNPWVDTIEYDFIPGISVIDYVTNLSLPLSPDQRYQTLLDFYDTTLVGLAKGRILAGGRSFLPPDFNAGSLIITGAEINQPVFNLIDLDEGVISDQPARDSDIRVSRDTLIQNINLLKKII